MIKKGLSVLLALLMVAAALPMTASAGAIVTYTANTITHIGAVRAGETIVLAVKLSSSKPVNAVQAALCFDHEKWQAVSGIEGDFLASEFSFYTVNTAPYDDATDRYIPGKVIISAMSLNNTNVPANTLLATVTLKALCDIEYASTFRVEDVSAKTNMDTALTCEAVNGKIVMLYPDVNGDTELSLSDATALFYAVNGLITLTSEQQATADITRDGEVTLTDATMMFYYVNGLLGY